MSTRAHRYGRPQMHEDPIKDAVVAEQAAVNMEVKAIRATAAELAQNGSTALADQLHHACNVLQGAGETLWNRVRDARKDEEKAS